MASARNATRMSYAEYAALEDDRRYELIDGEAFVIPAPTWNHQRIVSNIHFILKAHVDAHALGYVLAAPLDVILTEEDVLQPDVIFLSTANARLIAEAGLRGGPDLVVEVLSPGTASRDRKDKSPLYARHGVKELWIADPLAERIEVFRPTGRPKRFKLASLHEGDDKVHSAVLPQLTLLPRDAFKP